MKKVFLSFMAAFCVLLCGCGLVNGGKGSGTTPARTPLAGLPYSQDKTPAPTQPPWEDIPTAGQNGSFPSMDEFDERMTNYRIVYEYGGASSAMASTTKMRYNGVLLEYFTTDSGRALNYYDLDNGIWYILNVDEKFGYGTNLEGLLLQQQKKLSAGMPELFLYYILSPGTSLVEAGTEKIAGRDTIVYRADMELEDYSYSAVYWVDDGCGLTLKYVYAENGQNGASETVFEVKEIEVGKVTAADLPDLEEYKIEMRQP